MIFLGKKILCCLLGYGWIKLFVILRFIEVMVVRNKRVD